MKSVPQRMCVGCREMKSKKELIRVVRSPQGELSIDPVGKMPGRGAYICSNDDCLKKAVKNRGIERALNIKIDDELWEQIKGKMPAEN